MSVKGDWPRKCSTTREEKELRETYARTRMTRAQFEDAFTLLKEKGLIKRNGRVIK